MNINPLNARLNTICHLLALLGAHHILHVSRVRVNLLTPNDPYMGRTAPLTSKRCILYIYSTNIGTEYFFSSKCSLFHNANLFGSCIIHILYTECAKIKKKIIPAPKGISDMFQYKCTMVRENKMPILKTTNCQL